MNQFRIEKWNRSSVPHAPSLKLQLENEGFRVFQWSDEPQATYSLHKHSADQSHWIISGALELMIEDAGTYVLEAGDRDFMPANTNHSARVVGDEPVVYLIGEKA